MLLKNRFIQMLTVAAMMVVVMAASALPAFAAPPSEGNDARASEAAPSSSVDAGAIECVWDCLGVGPNAPPGPYRTDVNPSERNFCKAACVGPTNP